jgi:hypothetical protein
MMIRAFQRHARLVAGLGLLGATTVLALVAPTAPVPSAGAAGAVTCTQDWQPAPVAAYLTPTGQPTDPPRPLPPAPSPDAKAFHVFCGGRYVSTVWRAPVVDIAEATRLAATLVGGIAYPAATLGVNPARGLTGLPSWFWAVLDTDAVDLLAGNGPGLALQLRVVGVAWDFGDGLPRDRGLGSPYPTPSAVQHVYERTGTYTVGANLQVEGTFQFGTRHGSVTGAHSLTLRHQVVQVRGLLHGS